MKRILLPCAILLAFAFAAPASAGGVTICNGTGKHVGFALGYVGASGMKSAGPFPSEPGKCVTLLTEIAKGPFYIYAETPTGAMAWTAHGAATGKPFCVSDSAVVMRNAEHMKDRRLVCPQYGVLWFMLIPDLPPGAPKFTFTQDNADH